MDEINEIYASLDKKFTELKAAFVKTDTQIKDPQTDPTQFMDFVHSSINNMKKHIEACNASLREHISTVEKGISQASNKYSEHINRVDDKHDTAMAKHFDGHLPPIKGAEKMQHALACLGIDKDYDIQKPSIKASVPGNSGDVVTFPGSKMYASINKNYKEFVFEVKSKKKD